MSQKADYTPEEWKTLMTAPMLVGFAVVGASPSGPVGTVKEMASMSRSVFEAGRQASVAPLLAALTGDLQAHAEAVVKGREQDTERIAPSEARMKALDACKRTASILAQKATDEEADSIKGFLVSMAEKVSEASKEGGFLGFGGTQVSAAERAAVSDIATALGAKA